MCSVTDSPRTKSPQIPCRRWGRLEQRKEPPRNGWAMKAFCDQHWGQYPYSAWTQSLGNTQGLQVVFGRLCFFQMSEDTSAMTVLGTCREFIYSGVKWRQRFILILSSAKESGMRTQQGDSSTTAIIHKTDGRKGDICFQRISRWSSQEQFNWCFNFRTVIFMGSNLVAGCIF